MPFEANFLEKIMLLRSVIAVFLANEDKFGALRIGAFRRHRQRQLFNSLVSALDKETRKLLTLSVSNERLSSETFLKWNST